MKLPQQLNLPLSIPDTKRGESFVEDVSNHQAYAWIKRWPDCPVSQAVIFGERGCGKTHLGQLLLERSNGILVTPALTEVESPRYICQQGTTFVVDDYDQITDDTWLFHFYNIAQEHKNTVLYLGRSSPGQITFNLPDLQSRLRSLLALGIHSPSEDLQRQLLAQLLNRRGLSITDEITEYVLRRIERSYQAIIDLVDKIDVISLSRQRPVTLPLLRDVLNETYAL